MISYCTKVLYHMQYVVNEIFKIGDTTADSLEHLLMMSLRRQEEVV